MGVDFKGKIFREFTIKKIGIKVSVAEQLEKSEEVGLLWKFYLF